MSKETAAQRVERIKKEKDGLDVLQDIYVYAVLGEAVNPEDIDRFKWYGLYTQNRNLQDENDNTLYFMLRVKLPNGELNLEQIERLAHISNEYARGTADFTTRQDIQFHYITVANLPAIFTQLHEVGLSTVFAAGDVPRNVVTCPVNGIDHDQICDVRPLVEKVNAYFAGNKNLSNLPRKYKVSISGCNKHCISHEIQDLSFTATKVSDTKTLFDVHVGGGLASNKQFAHHIGYVTASQVLPTVKAVSKIYKEHGNRENRRKARLGHIIQEWGIEKFKEVLHENINFVLKEQKVQDFTAYEKREHFGIHESTVRSKSYIGCAISSGNITATGLLNLLSVMKKYEATTIKTTTTQNFVILDAPTLQAQEMAKDLDAVNIQTKPSVFNARTLACTGLNFCKFAISETKGLAKEIVAHLEHKFPDFQEKISISVNGCPNSCAHPHIVDIGLIGCKVKQNDETVTGFELVLGGHLEGSKSRFGEKPNIKFPASDAPKIIEDLIIKYIKSGYTSFNDFVLKLGNDK
ncbi:MAG: nitrite/sulfite reductase [Candidatus Marinarcus sp.]|uniref:nitrite/sulfite reductase n=1 Tax=Candidatus Marinarcus sp. TaxID=3100987 RepID=UPI003B00372B